MCAEALATDGSGHLFVGDRDNSCIQMFAVDGVYMGPLLSEKHQSMEQPLQLRWNKAKSSLVVAHTTKTERYAISVIPVNVESFGTSGNASTSGVDREEKTSKEPSSDATADEEPVITDINPANKGSDVLGPRKVAGLTFEGNANSMAVFIELIYMKSTIYSTWVKVQSKVKVFFFPVKMSFSSPLVSFAVYSQ